MTTKTTKTKNLKKTVKVLYVVVHEDGTETVTPLRKAEKFNYDPETMKSIIKNDIERLKSACRQIEQDLEDSMTYTW